MYIRTYIHTYIQTHLPACLQASREADIHLHACKNSFSYIETHAQRDCTALFARKLGFPVFNHQPPNRVGNTRFDLHSGFRV